MEILIEKHICHLTPHPKHPFKKPIKHLTPSVFYADQRGGCTFPNYDL